MSVLKSLCIAFSIYSKIPMPQFDWKEKDMRYSLCFFPWIGAVIGALEWGWKYLADRLGLGTLCLVCVGTAIPILITGGFHVDGFMDTCDALHSYRSREEKLEILKDPHIGAFSVIMLVLYFLLFVAGLSEVSCVNSYLAVCGGFYLARALSGLMVVTERTAKKDGLLVTFANTAHRRVVQVALCLQIGLGMAWFFYWDVLTAVLTALVLGAFLLLYHFRMKKELGGITGDTAGYFVTVSELLIVLCGAVRSVLLLQ